MAGTYVTTGEARLSYTDLLVPVARNPGDEPKYSVTVLIPKHDTATKAALDNAIEAAIADGTARLWGGTRPPRIDTCVHDGDGGRPSDGMPYGTECHGHWVFTASSKYPPEIVDTQMQPIISVGEIYSGMYGRVAINFYPYNNQKKGIGCGLNCVQKTRDGESLVSRISANEAFGAWSAPAAAPFNTAPSAAPSNPVPGFTW